MLRKFHLSASLFLIFSSLTQAGILDGLKSPSELLQNQKSCLFFNRVQGEMVDGKFLYGNIRVLAEFKKLGKDRISFRRLGNTEDGESFAVLVLSVVKEKNNLFALLPNGTIVLSCTL